MSDSIDAPVSAPMGRGEMGMDKRFGSKTYDAVSAAYEKYLGMAPVKTPLTANDVLKRTAACEDRSESAAGTEPTQRNQDNE